MVIPFVLSIEDNEADFALLAMALRECIHAIEVRNILDGREALTFFQELSPSMKLDLVLLDLNIPCHNGFEVLAFLRTLKVTHHTPVVMFSSSRSAKDRERALSLGANEYITKPLSLDAMMIQLKGVCERYLIKPDGLGALARFEP